MSKFSSKMYAKMMNYIYSIIATTASSTTSIGSTISVASYKTIAALSATTTNAAMSIYNYRSSKKTEEATEEKILTIEEEPQIDTKDIQSVIHDYKRIRTRYQANKRIIAIDKKYQDELQDNIAYLQKLNADLNDDYITGWTKALEHRKTIIAGDLSVLCQSQKAFKEFSMKEETHDVDTLTLCNICMENKKDRSLNCGHIFCNACLEKMNSCPTCRMEFEQGQVRHVFI